RSAGAPQTSTPSARISSIVRSTSSCFRPWTKTLAPSRASHSAVVRPSPRVLPVTSACLPARRLWNVPVGRRDSRDDGLSAIRCSSCRSRCIKSKAPWQVPPGGLDVVVYGNHPPTIGLPQVPGESMAVWPAQQGDRGDAGREMYGSGRSKPVPKVIETGHQCHSGDQGSFEYLVDGAGIEVEIVVRLVPGHPEGLQHGCCAGIDCGDQVLDRLMLSCQPVPVESQMLFTELSIFEVDPVVESTDSRSRCCFARYASKLTLQIDKEASLHYRPVASLDLRRRSTVTASRS